MFYRCSIIYDTRTSAVVYVRIPETFWDDLAGWSGEADMIGLPVVLVVLAAVASLRWGLLAAAGLLLFPLLDVATYSSDSLPFVDWVRWSLLVAAVLVASAVRVRGNSPTFPPFVISG